MDYRRNNITPRTCNYWRNGNCRHGDRCMYIHGFICHNDGHCTNSYCTNKVHLRQRDPSTYLKSNRNRRYSRSPKRRSYSYSPKRRRSYTPRDSRSRSRSPKRSSRSPKRSNRTSKKSSRSPYASSQSRSPYYNKPSRRSFSPYKGSTRRSHSSEKNVSPSYTPKGPPTHSALSSRSSSPVPIKKANKIKDNSLAINSKSSHAANNDEEYSDMDILTIKEDYNEDGLFDEVPTKSHSPNQIIEANVKNIGSVKGARQEKKSVFPSSRALEIFNNLPKDFFPKDEEGAKVVSTDQDAFRHAFLKALGQSEKSSDSQGLPPVMKHPLNAESLARPFQDKLYDTGNNEAGLWTPALSRNKSDTSKNVSASSDSVSNWEIDTPYVSRRSGGSQMPAPVAPSKESKSKSSKKNKSPEEIKKKRKKRRRKHSSSSSSSPNMCSSSSDEGTQNKDKKPDANANEDALEKKKNILSKVWSLMGQKKKLELQRDEIVVNHKGDAKSLTSLLQENGNLSSEIDKQIFLMNQMVQLINDKLGISKSDAQQQEFYLQPKMFEEKSLPPKITPANFNKSSLEKSLSQFMKKKDDVAPKKVKKLESRSPSKSKERKRSPSIEKKSKKQSKKAKKERSSPSQEEKKKKLSVVAKVKTPMVKKEEEYAPSASMKPHIKYIDQGMHWCKVCNEFFDSVKLFITHLESVSHAGKLKNDKKDWLPKAPKFEKDVIHPGAPVLTIPLQGMEFMHSMTAFYCSLCDDFIKTTDEAQNHLETKLHVSKYKIFLSSNPMFETTHVKQKMAAFARYSVEKEKSRERSSTDEVTTQESFFSEVRRKSTENIARQPALLSLGHGKLDELNTDALSYPIIKEKEEINLMSVVSESTSDDLNLKPCNNGSETGFDVQNVMGFKNSFESKEDTTNSGECNLFQNKISDHLGTKNSKTLQLESEKTSLISELSPITGIEKLKILEPSSAIVEPYSKIQDQKGDSETHDPSLYSEIHDINLSDILESQYRSDIQDDKDSSDLDSDNYKSSQHSDNDSDDSNSSHHTDGASSSYEKGVDTVDMGTDSSLKNVVASSDESESSSSNEDASTSIRVRSRSTENVVSVMRKTTNHSSSKRDRSSYLKKEQSKQSMMQTSKSKLVKQLTEESNDAVAIDESKKTAKKLPSCFIGKMPFLKKFKPIIKVAGCETLKTKTEAETPISTISEAEERIRKLVSQGLHNLNKKEEASKSDSIIEVEMTGNKTVFHTTGSLISKDNEAMKCQSMSTDVCSPLFPSVKSSPRADNFTTKILEGKPSPSMLALPLKGSLPNCSNSQRGSTSLQQNHIQSASNLVSSPVALPITSVGPPPPTSIGSSPPTPVGPPTSVCPPPPIPACPPPPTPVCLPPPTPVGPPPNTLPTSQNSMALHLASMGPPPTSMGHPPTSMGHPPPAMGPLATSVATLTSVPPPPMPVGTLTSVPPPPMPVGPPPMPMGPPPSMNITRLPPPPQMNYPGNGGMGIMPSSNFNIPPTQTQSSMNYMAPTHGSGPIRQQFDGSSIRPPFNGSPMQQFDGSNMQQQFNGSPMRPPFDGSPLRPPFDGSPLRPPFDGSPMRPPFDGSPMRQPINGSPMSSSFNGSLRSPFDGPLRSPFDGPLRPPFDRPMGSPMNFNTPTANRSMDFNSSGPRPFSMQTPNMDDPQSYIQPQFKNNDSSSKINNYSNFSPSATISSSPKLFANPDNSDSSNSIAQTKLKFESSESPQSSKTEIGPEPINDVTKAAVDSAVPEIPEQSGILQEGLDLLDFADESINPPGTSP